MDRRNWLDLSRKLIDRYDLSQTMDWVSQAINQASKSFFGEGVLVTTQAPNPFVITPSNSVLGGNVGVGVAYDINGQYTAIPTSTTTSTSYVNPTADLFNYRYDLLVIEYVATGDTPIPKPSDPISTVNLNLHDDFQLIIIPGTPSVTPAYPAKQNSSQIILAGIQVPPNSTSGTQCALDLSIRELSFAGSAYFPVFAQEIPTGNIDGSNTLYNLSQAPVNVTSVLVKLDGRVLSQSLDYSISGSAITLSQAPIVGQSIEVYYVVNSSSSQNPLSGFQEIPTGATDGSNPIFALSGVPANKISTLVFVDGLALMSSEWDLIQGATSSKIGIHAGSIPYPGQNVYVFYLVNPASVIIQQNGGGGGGGGGDLTLYGSYASPELISTMAGLSPGTEGRQYWFVASTGGAINVIANPQIQPGSILGQELTLRGVSDTNYIIFADGNGLSLNGPIELTKNSAIELVWDGSYWFESSRR